MNRPRPARASIAALMVAVLAASLGIAALRSASGLWASSVLTTTLVGLGFATLAVAYRRGGRRAWWAGFALFGWGYLAVAIGLRAFPSIGPRLATTRILGAMHARLADAFGTYEGDEPPLVPMVDPRPLPAEAAEYLRGAVRLEAQKEEALAAKYLKVAFDHRMMLNREERAELFDHRDLLEPADRAILTAEHDPPSVLRSPVGPLANFVSIGHCLAAALAGCLGGVFGVLLQRTHESPGS